MTRRALRTKATECDVYREAAATVAGDDDDLHDLMAAAEPIDGECTHLPSGGDDADGSDGEERRRGDYFERREVDFLL